MAVVLLLDTNIFLEILLEQDRSKACKELLRKNLGEMYISDFTLHSIGVILFKQNEDELFLKFITDILHKIQLLSLPRNKYITVVSNRKKYKLDFDDSYQLSVCKHFGLKLITMDHDFKKIEDTDIEFIK